MVVNRSSGGSSAGDSGEGDVGGCNDWEDCGSWKRVVRGSGEGTILEWLLIKVVVVVVGVTEAEVVLMVVVIAWDDCSL